MGHEVRHRIFPARKGGRLPIAAATLPPKPPYGPDFSLSSVAPRRSLLWDST